MVYWIFDSKVGVVPAPGGLSSNCWRPVFWQPGVCKGKGNSTYRHNVIMDLERGF
jgi:hypothetical protein